MKSILIFFRLRRLEKLERQRAGFLAVYQAEQLFMRGGTVYPVAYARAAQDLAQVDFDIDRLKKKLLSN